MEVRCLMAAPFLSKYLQEGSLTFNQRKLMYDTNAMKYLWAHFLVQYHEARGDKILVFCDSVAALSW